jgi:hypothetical protein
MEITSEITVAMILRWTNPKIAITTLSCMMDQYLHQHKEAYQTGQGEEVQKQEGQAYW